jgi:hypothetical protein
MWNVVGPFEVGSPADLEVGSEAVQSQNNRRYLHLAEEDSEVQIAVAIVADSAVAEGEEGLADGVEDSVEVEAASVADVMTLGVVDVAVAVADSGVYCVPYRSNCD